MRTTLGPIDLGSPVERGHPLNRGKLAWWLALPGQTGGPVLSDLFGRRPGTLSAAPNRPVWGGTGRPGGLGQLTLAGNASSYVDCAPMGASLAGLQHVSAACWTDRVPGTNFGLGQGLDGQRFSLLWSTDDRIYVEVESGGAFSYPSAGVAASGWHRLLLSYDGTASGLARLSLYLDGEPLALTAGGDGPAASVADPGPYTWAVGVSHSGSGYAGGTGAVDDAPVWTRSLSADEAAAEFDQSRRGYPDMIRRLSNRLTMAMGSGTAAGGFKPWFVRPAVNIGVGVA